MPNDNSLGENNESNLSELVDPATVILWNKMAGKVHEKLSGEKNEDSINELYDYLMNLKVGNRIKRVLNITGLTGKLEFIETLSTDPSVNKDELENVHILLQTANHAGIIKMDWYWKQ